jgi:hypothetical protein
MSEPKVSWWFRRHPAIRQTYGQIAVMAPIMIAVSIWFVVCDELSFRVAVGLYMAFKAGTIGESLVSTSPQEKSEAK